MFLALFVIKPYIKTSVHKWSGGHPGFTQIIFSSTNWILGIFSFVFLLMILNYWVKIFFAIVFVCFCCKMNRLQRGSGIF